MAVMTYTSLPSCMCYSMHCSFASIGFRGFRGLQQRSKPGPFRVILHRSEGDKQEDVRAFVVNPGVHAGPLTHLQAFHTPPCKANLWPELLVFGDTG